MSNMTLKPFILVIGFVSSFLLANDGAETHQKDTELSQEKSETSKGETRSRFKRKRYESRREDFGASFQIQQTQKEMKDFLSDEKGYGVGAQWWHGRRKSRISRTRLEWNVFPEGTRPDGSKGKAKQYLIAWDHLVKLNQGPHYAYLLGGLGGVRWCLEETRNDVRHKQQTTKLHFTAGLGMRVANSVAFEARYVVSSINKTFDGNSAQLSLSWCF